MNTLFRWLTPTLVALAASGPLVAQQALPASSVTAAPARQTPVLVRLEYPLSAATAVALGAEGIRILHHYGQGRSLLSAQPQSFAVEVLSAADLEALHPEARELSAYDQLPELRPTVQAAERLRRARLSADAPAFDPLAPAPAAAKTPTPSSTADLHVRTTLTLALAFPGAQAHLTEVLAEADFRPTGIQIEGGTSLTGTVTAVGLTRLLAHPFVLDASAPPGEDVPYNFETRLAHHVTALNSGIAGAPHLNGAGVVIGVGDGGALSGHPDLGNRVLHSTTYYNAGWGTHPDMVAGIVAAGGVVDPNHRGTAAEAELVIEASSTITFLAPTYQANYGMTLTNNSYGPTFHCSSAGRYYSSSASLDQQLYDNPKLLHVFAAGNSGRTFCAPQTSAPYNTFPGGPQCGKNTISVGNAYHYRQLFSSSSAGPMFDGRLKPDVVGVGSDVVSNNRSASYGTGSGTSYSSPAVVGLLALLSEHYAALHAGDRPDGALLKAVLCNTAEDLGNPGPDFRWGYGLVDGTAALQTFSQAQYHQGELAPAATYTRTLNVAAGTEQLAVLLYWPDVQGPTRNEAPVLVNDFDLVLVTPSGDTLRPWILDPVQPALVATRGVDRLNNTEQVTIAAPTPGNYTLVVRAHRLPLGNSDFVLTWRLPQPGVQLTCPFGGETLTPGQPTFIAWNATPGQTGTWTLEYAQAAGSTAKAGDGTASRSTWTPIQSGVAAGTRSIVWTPPNTVGTYVVRITNDLTGLTDATDEPVGLLAAPNNLNATPVCNGDMRLTWRPVPGAIAYEVFRFDGANMLVAGTVTDTVAFVSNLVSNQQTLFSVRAKGLGGVTSQRAYAVAETPAVNGMNCYSPLPVTWTGISTEERTDGVRVHWSVASEYNNDFYELMRGAPQGDTLDWTLVRTVDGRGTTHVAADFVADDPGAPAEGTVYYRVVQQDFDGARVTSATVAHTRHASGIAETSAVTLSQNPVVGDIELRLNQGHAASVELYDAAGRRVRAYEVEPGANRLPWPAHLPRGLYLLRVAGAEGATALKLIRA